jgi:hypothetical protein
MKNQKGFIVPFIIIMAVALSVGGGLYYKNNIIKSDAEVTAEGNMTDNTNLTTEINTDEDTLNETGAVTPILSNNTNTTDVDSEIKFPPIQFLATLFLPIKYL